MQSLPTHHSLFSDYACAVENFAWTDQYANSTIFDPSEHFQKIVSDIQNILYNALYDCRNNSPLIQILVLESKKQETNSTTLENIKNATPFEKLILFHTFRKLSQISEFSEQEKKLATLLLGINPVHVMNHAIQTEITKIHHERLGIIKMAFPRELNPGDVEFTKEALGVLDDALEILEKRIEELQNLEL
jgi:hypothetical protein